MGESSLAATVTQLSAFIDSGLSDINTRLFILQCVRLSHLLDIVILLKLLIIIIV